MTISLVSTTNRALPLSAMETAIGGMWGWRRHAHSLWPLVWGSHVILSYSSEQQITALRGPRLNHIKWSFKKVNKWANGDNFTWCNLTIFNLCVLPTGQYMS